MGQQINFYMTPRDLEIAMKHIMGCGEYVILHYKSSQSKPNVVPNLEFEENGKPWLYFYLTRSEFLPLIKMYEVPAQKYWAIDSLRSPVLELNRSFFDGKNLRMGRIYFHTNYYDDVGRKVTKSEAFLIWTKCILAVMKKTLKLDRSLGVYIGTDAMVVSNEGGNLLKPTDVIS